MVIAFALQSVDLGFTPLGKSCLDFKNGIQSLLMCKTASIGTLEMNIPKRVRTSSPKDRDTVHFLVKEG